VLVRHAAGGRDATRSAFFKWKVDAESGNAGGRGIGRSQLTQGSPEPLTVFFAVNGATKFAVANLPNWTDIFAAV
jgi:hypothetical protein